MDICLKSNKLSVPLGHFPGKRTVTVRFDGKRRKASIFVDGKKLKVDYQLRNAEQDVQLLDIELTY